MTNHSKFKFILCVMLVSAHLFVARTSFAIEESGNLVDARIKGVAQFLLDRANENFLFILEQNMKDNDLLRDYFPNTHYFITTGDLTLLLKSNKQTWSEIVEQDLRQMIERYIILKIGGHNAIQKLGDKLTPDKLDTEVGNKLTKYKNELEKDSSVPPKIKQKVLRKLYQYTEELESLTETIDKLHIVEFSDCINAEKNKSKPLDCQNNWDMFKETNWRQYLAYLAIIGTLGNKLFSGIKQDIETANFGEANIPYDNELWKFVNSNSNSSWWINELKTKNNLCAIKALSANKAVDINDQLIKTVSSDQPLNLIFLEFERLAKECNSPKKEKVAEKDKDAESVKILGVDINSKSYKRFRKYVLFFTQLTDADNADQVEALMVEVTLPPTSFGIKREPGERHLMFSAYLGFLAGSTFSTAGEGNFENAGGYGGITAPMGIEWSYGCNVKKSFWSWLCPDGYSFNALIAPLDFAHPINVIVTDNTDNVELNDIIAPGLFFSWGVDGYPVNFGVGWQQGKAIRADSELENRYFVFLTFEIPMFILH